MAAARQQRKPTFLWQAVLILLPVLILALVGFFSLRQDRLLAQREATARAQTIADDLLPKIWSKLAFVDTNPTPDRAFQIDGAGRLVFPPPCAPVPTPQPFDFAELTSEQSRLWVAAQQAEILDSETALAADAWRKFLESQPPDRFSAAAKFALGAVLSDEGQRARAASLFRSVIEDHPDAVSEGGLRLQTLAEARLLGLNNTLPGSPRQPIASSEARKQVNIEADRVSEVDFKGLSAFCSNIMSHPTVLTPFFLNELVAKNVDFGVNTQAYRWRVLWAEHEQSRALYFGACQQLQIMEDFTTGRRTAGTDPTSTNGNPAKVSIPSLFWFTTPDPLPIRDGPETGVAEERTWLGMRMDSGHAIWIVCQGESEIGLLIRDMLGRTRNIPEYFAVGVEVGGRLPEISAPDLRIWHRYLEPHSKGGGQSWEKAYSSGLATNILASATHMEAGTETLKVNVFLTSPSALYKSQVARTYTFGLLIGLSALAAMIGLFAAWGAFNHQQRLNEMKSNFVSSVSHELRAPIASVRLMAESLERGRISEPAKQGEYFRFIGQECRRLSSLIENVLDFSRIEQGRKQYEFEPTDIVALLQQTVKLMEPYAVEKGVRLHNSDIQLPTSHIESTHPRPRQEEEQPRTAGGQFPSPEGPGVGSIELDVDGRAIQQALVNLIDNAIKHSPKGETVTVELLDATRHTPHASNLTPDTPHLVLSVTDHGPGIPASEQDKIFERFYRVGSEMRRETQGVGIGLSIVQHIVEAHGGCVRVESEPGQGSRFIIELPLKR